MPSRRRAPRTPEQRQQQWTRSLIPGSLGGGVANASPILPGVTDGRALARGAGGAFGASGQVLAYQDVFDLTAAGAQSKALTYLPLPHSEHVYLNGLYQRETDDWTRSDRTINVLAAMDARVGDVLAVEYLYASAVPVAPTEPSTLGVEATYWKASASGSVISPILLKLDLVDGVDINSPLYVVQPVLLFDDGTTAVGNNYNNWGADLGGNTYEAGDASGYDTGKTLNATTPVTGVIVTVDGSSHTFDDPTRYF